MRLGCPEYTCMHHIQDNFLILFFWMFLELSLYLKQNKTKHVHGNILNSIEKNLNDKSLPNIHSASVLPRDTLVCHSRKKQCLY